MIFRGRDIGLLAGSWLKDVAAGLSDGKESDMLKQFFGGLIRDERGGEVLEYAIIVGLIVVAAIVAITSVGTKVLAKWTSLDSSL